jgi:hypothetical protein
VRLPPIQYPGNVPGILYEPRAFWNVTQVNLEENPTGRVVLPREDFRNGEKWPVTLTHMLVAPINYALREFDSGLPTAPANYHLGGASVLNFARVLVSAPQRQGYSRRVIAANAFTPCPRWEPRTNNDSASALWNVVRWDFDHVMVLPRQGTLELQLSSVGFPNNLGNNAPTTTFAVIVNEGPPAGSDAPGTAGVWPGNGRIHQRSPVFYGNPGGGWPGVFPPDPIGNFNAPQGFVTSIVWPPQMQLSAREYDSQNVTNAGSTPTTGFAVAIDQLGLDTLTETNTPPGGFVSSTPLALRMAARARTRNGGTGHWWWRPGAPLALVTPTVTPAQVYRLPTPITLAPGDTLEVELQAQRPVPFGEETLDTLTNFGVSFTGSAAIEG